MSGSVGRPKNLEHRPKSFENQWFTLMFGAWVGIWSNFKNRSRRKKKTYVFRFIVVGCNCTLDLYRGRLLFHWSRISPMSERQNRRTDPRDVFQNALATMVQFSLVESTCAPWYTVVVVDRITAIFSGCTGFLYPPKSFVLHVGLQGLALSPLHSISAKQRDKMQRLIELWDISGCFLN